jgi:hypothetical protein
MQYRDPLIDLWRGLALVDMAWVHLAYPAGLTSWLTHWIGDYTRFAAGAFVVISGISVARVFGPKLVGTYGVVQATHRHLGRRALLLAVLDRLVSVGYVFIDQARLAPPLAIAGNPDIPALLCFREPGVTGGLLFLYAVLLTATPLIDWFRRRIGGWALVAGSLGIFVLAHAAEGTPQVAHWPFPVLYWQSFFVLGYALSEPLARWRATGGQVPTGWLTLGSAIFALVFIARNQAGLNLPLPLHLPELAFVKVPLSPAELVWYLAASGFVFAWSAWAWNQMPGRRAVFDWLCLLGRQSLVVYIAHLFIEPPLLAALALMDLSPGVRTAVLPLTLLILVAVAAVAEQIKRRRTVAPVQSAVWLRVPITGLRGSTAAAGAVVALLTLQVAMGPPSHWAEAPFADAPPPAHLPVEEGGLVATDEGTNNQWTLPEVPLNEGEPALFDPAQEPESAEGTSET